MFPRFFVLTNPKKSLYYNVSLKEVHKWKQNTVKNM